MQRFLFFYILLVLYSCNPAIVSSKKNIRCGDERTELYFPLLKDKKFALLSNQSSLIGNTHLVDSLISSGLRPLKIFTPEHGFRGDEDAGAEIKNDFDKKTGIPLISLYGKNKKPKKIDMEGLDVIVIDIQDVGTRFYTYISTMHYVMEASIENNVEIIILDRPNPNGDYIDGPILDNKYSSFAGMHPVPVVHGMTMGEYAKMIIGESWIPNSENFHLTIIPCENYSHNFKYVPRVNPSPNLPNYQAIRLYPSLCFFEGTKISIGRGTDFPFQVYGHPEMDTSAFKFTPESRPGAALNPRYKNIVCGGVDLRNVMVQPADIMGLNLFWLIDAYQTFDRKEVFFTSYFDLLAGTDKLRKQIESGLSAEEIKSGWKPGLDKFVSIREKYLIYP